KTIGAARLIETRAAPEAAAQRLVEQPAVRHRIHRGIGRVHIDRAQRAVPVAPYALERCAAGARATEATDQPLHLAKISAHAEAEADFALLSLGEIEGDLHR